MKTKSQVPGPGAVQGQGFTQKLCCCFVSGTVTKGVAVMKLKIISGWFEPEWVPESREFVSVQDVLNAWAVSGTTAALPGSSHHPAFPVTCRYRPKVGRQ